jgi:hypothetical protein
MILFYIATMGAREPVLRLDGQLESAFRNAMLLPYNSNLTQLSGWKIRQDARELTLNIIGSLLDVLNSALLFAAHGRCRSQVLAPSASRGPHNGMPGYEN